MKFGIKLEEVLSSSLLFEFDEFDYSERRPLGTDFKLKSTLFGVYFTERIGF